LFATRMGRYHGDGTMNLQNWMYEEIRSLFKKAAEEQLNDDAYSNLCKRMGVAKMYYEMDLGSEGKYRDISTGRLVMAEKMNDKKIILYESDEETDLKLVYPYFFRGAEYVHAYIEFKKGIVKEDLDLELYEFLADMIYTLASRRNMRIMLDFAETMDLLTGIPNVIYMGNKYDELTQRVDPQELLVIRLNIQNFKHINEVGGANCGDEVIIKYARTIIGFINEDECVCRLGGDNFVAFIYKDNLEEFEGKLNNIVINHLENAKNHTFEISTWMGISELADGEIKPFGIRLNDASSACDVGKSTLKKRKVYFNKDLVKIISYGHDIIAMFKPAIRNREFVPYFQPKVDMRSGEVVGFEALCRWSHEGRTIYPDQFIPILDQAGLIPELDIEIFRRTCSMIKIWKDMGLKYPVISTNFSKKNLYVPDLEYRIIETIKENGLNNEDLEIEITESVKEDEVERLIQFVKRLRENGVHISIDDFGTGYSSLSLIHNIDAEIIKIDKSFVNTLLIDKKSNVLVESIISIAERLGIRTIAEGVESEEQGRVLQMLGCSIAQGYYYSKPMDYEAATEVIKNPVYKPILIQRFT